jgi:hypothetical protein
MITLLLSAYNEEDNPYFWETISLIQELQLENFSIEVIVGLTRGSDQTFEKLMEAKIKIIEIETSKRSERYNIALTQAQAGPDNWVILHHPRSLLQREGILALATLDKNILWGAYTQSFSIDHPLLYFTSWWSNKVRGDLKKIFYLDHCLFVRRKILDKVGNVPQVEIFEDTLLSIKLSREADPVRLPYKSTTSAIRFEKNGFLKQIILNQVLKFLFLINYNNESINAEYEKGLNLNTFIFKKKRSSHEK